MKPIVTVDEMKEIDASAKLPTDVLVDRAGRAVARTAKRMLGGLYGRRVIVIAGKGKNGSDGKVAAGWLAKRGAGVRVVGPNELKRIPTCDLVIDAAYGTGLGRSYDAPVIARIPVLSVDVPSGLDGDTGDMRGRCIRADETVTFAALKPGLLFGHGPSRTGYVSVADIGLDVSSASMWLVDNDDYLGTPTRERTAHKWESAVAVIAGSVGMTGAALLCSSAAQRSGAGMVRLLVPGAGADLPATDAVAEALPARDWLEQALTMTERVGAVVVGPGLGRNADLVKNVAGLIEKIEVPLVIDGDALSTLESERMRTLLRKRKAATVLTPHDGEFKYITGNVPSKHRWIDARRLADDTAATVLLKGPATVIAHTGEVTRVAAAGDQRLATAGSGDVLSGIIGSFLAQGFDAIDAAALGAHVHGAAAKLGPLCGLTASDLPRQVARWMSDMRNSSDKW